MVYPISELVLCLFADFLSIPFESLLPDALVIPAVCSFLPQFAHLIAFVDLYY